MGAVTFTHQKKWKDNAGMLHMLIKIRMSSSYATGGDKLDLSGLMRNIRAIIPIMLEDSGGYKLQITDTRWATPKHADGIKIMAFLCNNASGAGDSPLLEVGAISLTAVYGQIEVIGTPA